MKTKHFNGTALALACALVGGCSFHARSPDDYRKAVREALEQRSSQVESCYKQELGGDPAAAGNVVVKFDVEAKTGKIVNPLVDDVATTSNEQVQQCVLSTLDGLKIEPPDHRQGRGTFTWAFSQ